MRSHPSSTRIGAGPAPIFGVDQRPTRVRHVEQRIGAAQPLEADERAKDRTRLHELEDEAVRRVVRRQEELGLEVVSDGEFRRLMYFNSFFDAVDGRRIGLLDGPTVTARRTAAVSLLAAQRLAPRTDGPLLIVGAGVQG